MITDYTVCTHFRFVFRVFSELLTNFINIKYLMIPLSKSINTSDLFTPSRMHYKMKEKKKQVEWRLTYELPHSNFFFPFIVHSGMRE